MSRNGIGISAASLIAGMVLGAAGAPLLQAQSRPPQSAIDGIVTDTSLAPLSDVTVSILRSNLRVVTGSNGRFRIVDVAPGEITLLVRRIGFEAAMTNVRVTEGETQRVSFSLQRATNALGQVTITEKQLGWRMTEFEERRKLGEGQFMTQAEIEKRSVADVSDLLATFRMGLRGPSGLGAACAAPAVFLDGVRMPTDTKIDDVLIPKELAGIEAYIGPATIPLQYKTSGSSCGVILFWTRVGS